MSTKILSFSDSFFAEIKDSAITPDISDTFFTFMDADEELEVIAKFLQKHVLNKEDIELDRIKFLYCNKPRKDGGRYLVGQIIPRSDIERAVDDRYDYIVCVYHPVWKNLDIKHKVIQLDKILCGVSVEVDRNEQRRVKKNQADTREFQQNINFFGADEVLKSSEIIDLAVAAELERQKEEKKNG